MDLSESELRTEIANVASVLDGHALRLWERVRIPPCRWPQSTYSDVGPVWVVGLIGARCLCFNPVDEGWGWAPFELPGVITELHFEEYDLHHVIHQEFDAIVRDGRG